MSRSDIAIARSPPIIPPLRGYGVIPLWVGINSRRRRGAEVSHSSAPPASPSPTAAPTAASATIKPTDLRGILQYVPRFQDQIFIIALDGAIVADENFPNLLVDIAVLRSLAIKVVLVHGIGQQIQELSRLRDIPISNSDGSGVTDTATLDLAVRASARVSHLILEG